MRKNSILLVDDDETLLRTFQLILRDEGYIVDTATTGRRALESARKTKYDLVILDIVLPDIQGDEVAKELRMQTSDVIIVFITGYPSFQESIDALDIGVHEILLKPITPEEILRVVREALKKE